MSTTDEIMDLAGEWAQETKDFGHLSESRPRDALFKAVEALMSDAAQWKAYKARKDAALSAGFGRSPLRGEVAPDTYAVINEYGQVEYSARWIEACHDHIKDMQEVLPPRATSKWKVRGIKILEKAP